MDQQEILSSVFPKHLPEQEKQFLWSPSSWVVLAKTAQTTWKPIQTGFPQKQNAESWLINNYQLYPVVKEFCITDGGTEFHHFEIDETGKLNQVEFI